VRLRQLWKLLSGVALLVTGFLLGASAPVGATTGGCAGDVVVALDVAVWSRPGHDTYGFTLNESLPPGEWAVTTSSSDAYTGRTNTRQDHEQWLLDITGHVVLGPTTDLADGVDAASVSDHLGVVSSASGISHFTVRHAVPSTPLGTESVTADCVAFTLVGPPTTTTTTTTTPPTTTAPPTTTTAPTTTTTTTKAPPPPTTTKAPPPARPEIRATAVVDCAADQVYVLLGNDGEAGARVDVALPQAALDSGVDVAGRSSTTSSLPIGQLDGGAEIRVSDADTGEIYVRTPIEIDCSDPARPTASTVLDCGADVLVVVLGNEAGDPAALTVVHERVAIVADVVVTEGETVQVEIPLAGAATIPVRVLDADGRDVVRVQVDNICPPSDPVPDDGDDTTDAEDPTGDAGGGADSAPATCAESVDAAPACAEVRVIVEPDCPKSLANVSIRREGIGRERFVVLLGGTIAGVMAIDGTGDGTVPVSVGETDAELTVSRSTSTEAIAVGVLRCGGGSSRAGPIAASLVVFAVLATAAGVMPWPLRPGPV
jgi:hypothetical protein